MVRRRGNGKVNYVKKLIGYDEEDETNLEELNESTELGFTEVQRKINKFFFSNPDNLDEVFGVEEDDDEEEDED
jgi:hypothetical protein